MHGRIFWQFREYVEALHGRDGWPSLLKQVGLDERIYMAQPYPDEEAMALINAEALTSGQSPFQVLQDFGAFTVTPLLHMCGGKIKPEWRALDVIENTERVAHGLVRFEQPGAVPPFLRTQRLDPRRLLLFYNSPRKWCAFAVGVGLGLGKHFDQPIVSRHRQCMHEGADHCEILFELLGR